MSGSASATINTAAGQTRLAGSDSLTWADRLIAGPVDRVELSLPAPARRTPLVRFDGGGSCTAAASPPSSAEQPPPARPAAHRRDAQHGRPP